MDVLAIESIDLRRMFFFFFTYCDLCKCLVCKKKNKFVRTMTIFLHNLTYNTINIKIHSRNEMTRGRNIDR